MSMTVLIGGARSGKSALAAAFAGKWGGPVTFIATAEARDEEMRARIAQHRETRDPAWTTLEEPCEITQAISSVPAESLIVLDCLTLWASNLLDRGLEAPDGERRAREASSTLARRHAPAIVVTNEVGSGIVPANPAARTFRDLLGSINSIFANDARRVLFVTAGRVLSMKRPEEVFDDVLDR